MPHTTFAQMYTSLWAVLGKHLLLHVAGPHRLTWVYVVMTIVFVAGSDVTLGRWNTPPPISGFDSRSTKLHIHIQTRNNPTLVTTSHACSELERRVQ